MANEEKKATSLEKRLKTSIHKSIKGSFPDPHLHNRQWIMNEKVFRSFFTAPNAKFSNFVLKCFEIGIPVWPIISNPYHMHKFHT